MEKHPPPWTLGRLAELLGGDLDGPEDLLLEGPATVECASPRGVAFVESEKFARIAESVELGAVLLPRDFRKVCLPSIKVDNPRAAFARILAWSERELRLEKGIHPTAIVHPEAVVQPCAAVGPFAVVERGARLGAKVRVFPFCYVGEDCVVGDECVLYPHVVLYRDVTLGARTVVHAGTVLGADGFGFVWDGQRRAKVPQAGKVQVGEDVEIGANSAVDRATAGATRIGDGTKLDNLVQIAHNVTIGEHGAIAALTGIAGSAKVGDRVVMGGNVVVRDHVRVTDDAAIGGRTTVDEDVDKPGEYWGTPVRPAREAIRIRHLIARLPELFARLKALEARILGKREGAED